ncbi:MAG: hypothetical protein OIF32_08185 [Campylobacterales bacterium]|nr:hypothetical protein [Campylobacterales bacterium]
MSDLSKEERKIEELSRSKMNEVNQLFDDIAENPEKLTMDLAIDIYNNYYFKRDQIISIYFGRIKNLDMWMSIYKMAKENEDIRPFSLESIKGLTSSSEDWINLFESEKDEEILKIAVNKVGENSNNLDDWINVYQLSSYGTEISSNALINMRKHAKSHQDWKRIYDITPFDSKAKNFALEQLMLTAVDKEEQEIQEEDDKKKSHEDTNWGKEYERIDDFHAGHKDLALINKYIFADHSAK